MAGDYVVGARGTVRVEITAVDDVAVPPTATVRVLNNNDVMVGTAATMPQGLVTATAQPFAVEDVIECLKDHGEFRAGACTIVRFVDPSDSTKWSFVPSGSPLLSSAGWRKRGTFDLDGAP